MNFSFVFTDVAGDNIRRSEPDKLIIGSTMKKTKILTRRTEKAWLVPPDIRTIGFDQSFFLCVSKSSIEAQM